MRDPGSLLSSSYERYWNKRINELTDDPPEELSACCGAPILWGDICSRCGEHTEPMEEE